MREHCIYTVFILHIKLFIFQVSLASRTMAFRPLENFRHFLSSRPPLVVFVVCIGMTAIAFISYAYYIKYNDVYNPDADEVSVT